MMNPLERVRPIHRIMVFMRLLQFLSAAMRLRGTYIDGVVAQNMRIYMGEKKQLGEYY